MMTAEVERPDDPCMGCRQEQTRGKTKPSPPSPDVDHFLECSVHRNNPISTRTRRRGGVDGGPRGAESRHFAIEFFCMYVECWGLCSGLGAILEPDREVGQDKGNQLHNYCT